MRQPLAVPARREALLRLDIAGTTGLLAFASQDPDRFGPDQGVDLLTFFGSVVERLAAQHLDQQEPG